MPFDLSDESPGLPIITKFDCGSYSQKPYDSRCVGSRSRDDNISVRFRSEATEYVALTAPETAVRVRSIGAPGMYAVRMSLDDSSCSVLLDTSTRDVTLEDSLSVRSRSYDALTPTVATWASPMFVIIIGEMDSSNGVISMVAEAFNMEASNTAAKIPVRLLHRVSDNKPAVMEVPYIGMYMPGMNGRFSICSSGLSRSSITWSTLFA